MIGPPIRTILAQAGNVTDERKLVDLEKAFRKSYDDEGWKMTACYPEVPSVLQAMHNAGIRLFVVTNKPLHISTRILERLGLTRLFAAVITRESRQPRTQAKKRCWSSSPSLTRLTQHRAFLSATPRKTRTLRRPTPSPLHLSATATESISEEPTTQAHYRVNTFYELYQQLAPGVCP